jgi:hypothetical protein
MRYPYRHYEVLYRVEGPPERDGMVCATPYEPDLKAVIEKAKNFPSGLDREKFTVVKKTTTTVIEKFSWHLATSGNRSSLW